MNIKTITTTDGVNTVDFGSAASRFYWFRNIGTTTVYVSGNSDISAGSNGVAELAAGDSVCIETLGGKVYVLGAGKVQIHNTGDKFCPFKPAPAQSGGEAVDAYSKTESDAKYASKALYGDTTINVGRKAGSTVGEKSTAEGFGTIASGYWSHAEGVGATASGNSSHAEGGGTIASDSDSHAEGYNTIASGKASHAEGLSTVASGYYSHAEGENTIANNKAEHASGSYNVSNEDTLFSIGDGTAEDARHNAFEITKTGGKLHDKDIAVKDDIISPNLLINPDFKINQRGGTSWGVSYSQGVPIRASQKYTVDRWRIMEGNAVITEGKFVLNGTIIQVLENSIGAEFTTTVNVESGSATANYDDTTKTFTITGENATLNWAKLEHGKTATPFIPPDPATELMRCRRYYRTMSRGTLAVAVNAASVAFVDSFDVPMRIDPTAKILLPVALNYCNGWLDQPDVTKMSIVSTNLTKMGACYIHVSGFNVTVGGTAFTTNFLFKAATDNFIEFDAEIY